MHSNFLIDNLCVTAKEAGEAILSVYDNGAKAASKDDGSPVTQADLAAEKIIVSALEKIAPDVAIVSEENSASHAIDVPSEFFLVDPLDGTKEFLKRDGAGSFTVNIALIRNGDPVLGVVYAPALDRMFAGAEDIGAFENGREIATRQLPDDPLALISVSHLEKETLEWLKKNNITNTSAIGSSLKFCLLAAGEADLYPRFGPTMEWDTAAGDAILRAAGGSMKTMDGDPFRYGKDNFRNGAFLASGER